MFFVATKSINLLTIHVDGWMQYSGIYWICDTDRCKSSDDNKQVHNTSAIY